MLAYTFWHWPRSDADPADYEARQRAFHEALAAEPPPGFHGSAIAAVTGAPWAAGGTAAYEDGYLVADFTALGVLNEAAVSRSRSRPHDAAASLAAGGAGAVHALRAGAPVPRPEAAHWLSKPADTPYGELLARLEPLVRAAGGALWMRQMVLGPAPEFCVHAGAGLALPPGLSDLSLSMRPVFSSFGNAHSNG